MLFVAGFVVGGALTYFGVRFFSPAYHLGERLLTQTENHFGEAKAYVERYAKNVFNAVSGQGS